MHSTLRWILPACFAGVLTAASPQSPEQAVQDLYRTISFAPGGSPDFKAIEDLFLPEACLALRAGSAFQIQNPAQFVKTYQANYMGGPRQAKGFEERILATEVRPWGEVAVARVIYEARIPGQPDPLKRGVDHLSLVRHQGRWWIASIVSEVETSGRPLPALTDLPVHPKS